VRLRDITELLSQANIGAGLRLNCRHRFPAFTEPRDERGNVHQTTAPQELQPFRCTVGVFAEPSEHQRGLFPRRLQV